MTLAHSVMDKSINEAVTIKSEESEDFDSNESVQDSDSISVKSEDECVEQSDHNDSNDESNKESDSNDDEDDTKANLGWADSVAKILKTNKPKNKKTLVLSKAKKLTDAKKEKPKDPGFQIEGEEVKEEKPDPLELLDKVKEDPGEPPRKKKKELTSVRVKPSPTDRERERSLAKIATRGVVQLFNAVRNQQKDIGERLESAGPLVRQKEQVLRSIDKRQFLDVLMGGENAKSEAIDQPVKKDSEENKDGSSWDVLKDDFMLSAKFKDWDKKKDDDIDEINDI